MGLFDKVKDIAASAKKELDKSGVLEHLAGDRPSEQVSPAEQWDAAGEMTDVIRRGGLDPRTLIGTEEVAAIAGHPVAPKASTGPYQHDGLSFEPMSVYWSLEGAGEVHSLMALHTEDDTSEWDAAATFDDYVCVDPDAYELFDGLGERACTVYNQVYVQQSGRVLGAEVTGDQVHDERSREQATAMLRLALERL